MTMEKNEEYMLLLNGKGRVRSFIHSENYRLDSTIVNDSKTTYLSKLIKRGITEVYHYVARNELLLPDAVIDVPFPTKFNKFKKNNIEAFFYWNEIQKLIRV